MQTIQFSRTLVQRIPAFGLLGFLLALWAGCSSNGNPSNPGSGSPTSTPTAAGPTATATKTFTATASCTPSLTATATSTATPTRTSTFTATSTDTATSTKSPTVTDTPTVTPTVTSTPTCSAPSGSYPVPSFNAGGDPVTGMTAVEVTVAGQVRITDFQLLGYNAASSAISEPIGIYADSGGSPSTLIASTTGSIPSGASNATISFTTPVYLSQGNYWLAAATNPQGFYFVGHISGPYPAVESQAGVVTSMPSNFGFSYSISDDDTLGADWVCP